MAILTDGVVKRSNQTLEEFEPSFSEYLGAKWDEATDFNPLSVIDDAQELNRAQYDIQNVSPAASFGGVDLQSTPRPRLSKDEILAKSQAAGVELEIPEDGLSVEATDFLIDRRVRQRKYQDVINRSEFGSRSAAGFGVQIAASFLDPLNIGLAFVPVIGPARYEMLLAKQSGALGRAGIRAGIGAAEGAAGVAVFEPLNISYHQKLQDDYSALDSLINIGFGSAFGGGLHVAGGAIKDAYLGKWWEPAINPAPSKEVTAGIYGANTQIKIGDQYAAAKWAVMDVEDINAAMSKADNQFRDRTRAASDTQVRDIANNIDFNLLAESPVMDFGAPTLSRDGLVIGGNGRVAAINKAHDIGTGLKYVEDLKAELSRFGIDPESINGMSRPALVRVLDSEIDIRKAAIASNEGGSMRMSALEQAKVDAERLGNFRAFEVSEDGNINTAENRRLINNWIQEQPVNQRSALMSGDGFLSVEGETRLRNSILFKAYGDSETLGRLVESTDPGSKNIANALVRSAGNVADAQEAIKSGDLRDLDISKDIAKAVEKLDQLRREKTTVDQFLAQEDLVGQDMSVEAIDVMRFMSENIRSPRAIADFINKFYDGVRELGNPKQGQLLDDVIELSKLDLMARSKQPENQVTAREIVEAATPQEREAGLRSAIGQLQSGKAVEIEPIFANVKVTTESAKWFEGSQVIDQNGNPLKVFHGSNETFDKFDYAKIGQNGRAEGAGFYFTVNEKIARGYGDAVKEVYLAIKKPLDYDAPGFKRLELRKILKQSAELEAARYDQSIGDGFLSNFGDVNYEGLSKVIAKAVDAIASDDKAIDQLGGLVGGGMDVEIVNTAVRNVTGFDGIKSKGFGNEGGDDIYVAFFPDQVRDADLFEVQPAAANSVESVKERMQAPESVRVADKEVSEAAEKQIIEAPKSESLQDAEADLARVMLDVEEAVNYAAVKIPDAGDRLFERVNNDFENVAKEYAAIDDKQLGLTTDSGRVLNTDLMREISPEYRGDRTRSSEVHEASSTAIKKIYADKLSKTTPEGFEPTVLFTGGGTGAGKSSGLELMGDLTKKAEIIYDTNMGGFESSVKKIEQALAAGRDVRIVYTYRDPVEALANGALPRAERVGRTVPLKEHAKTHIESNKTFFKMIEKYKDDPLVQIRAIDNSRGKNNAAVVDPQDIPKLTDTDNLIERLTNETEQQFKQGRIGEATYNGFTGKGNTTESGQASGGVGQVIKSGIEKELAPYDQAIKDAEGLSNAARAAAICDMRA